MPIVNENRGRHLYDISFVASFRCDLACTFCMYDSNPDVVGELDLDVARAFIATIDASCVNAFGLYGGEPALFIPQNTEILKALPKGKDTFIISNGTWSQDEKLTDEFMAWALQWQLQVYVSSTPQHQRKQNRPLLRQLAAEGRINLKEEKTNFIPMGKLANWNKPCTVLCDRDDRPTRIALKPDGNVMFQNCDGSYLVVGAAAEGFPVIRERLAQAIWRKACPVYARTACAR